MTVELPQGGHENHARAGAPGLATGTSSSGRVAAWLAKRVEVALTAVDLTLPQYRVLGILAEGSSAASGLADRLAVRRPSITALMDGLVARQLVDRRQEDSDRRRVSLRITARGARVLKDADEVLDAHLASLADHLPSEEREAALASLALWERAMAASRADLRAAESPSPTSSEAPRPDAEGIVR